MDGSAGHPDQELLNNLKGRLQELRELLKEISSHWGYEDSVYRFYHQSYKVYSLQEQTAKIAKLLLSLSPSGDISCFFQEIITFGTCKTFDLAHNKDWTDHTRPILEAFFHAKYFLEMAVKYGHELTEVPEMLPSGWAALLCLYNIR